MKENTNVQKYVQIILFLKLQNMFLKKKLFIYNFSKDQIYTLIYLLIVEMIIIVTESFNLFDFVQ